MSRSPSDQQRWLQALASRQTRSEHEWTTGLVLSITAGWLGLDRFYVGSPTLGLLKLLTLGGFGIWWATDIILLLTERMKDDDGRPLRPR